jgi:transposase-like protein
MFAVFIDGYHGKMREERMRDSHIHSHRHRSDGNKLVLGPWINDGNESKGSWSEIFQDLINRELKKVVLFVTDDFPSINIISKPYPLADHQLCWIHFTRNLIRHLSKAEYAEIKSDLYNGEEQQE